MIPPNQVSFDLGMSPLGIYLTNAGGNPAGVGHFCVSVEGFNIDSAVSTLRKRSIQANKATGAGAGAAGAAGVQFRDPDNINVELAPAKYHNQGAQPQKDSPPSAPPLFRPVALNHVTLQVSDLERSTKFYESLFGSSSQWSDQSDKRTFSVRFGIRELSWITYGVNPVGIDHFCVSVEDYDPDAVTEKLKQNGIMSRRLYQPNRVFIQDPDGILVQLAGPNYGQR